MNLLLISYVTDRAAIFLAIFLKWNILEAQILMIIMSSKKSCKKTMQKNTFFKKKKIHEGYTSHQILHIFNFLMMKIMSDVGKELPFRQVDAK